MNPAQVNNVLEENVLKVLKQFSDKKDIESSLLFELQLDVT